MSIVLRHIVVTLLGASVAFTVAPAHADSSSSLGEQCPAAAAWQKNQSHQHYVQIHALKAIKPSEPVLTKQLAQRAARDEASRNAAINANRQSRTAAIKRLSAVDKANLAWLKPEIETHGFPTIEQVGVAGVKNAWLLVQHADRDPAFQAQVLAELKPRLKVESFLKPEYALLIDRVRIHQHKKQVYGSQFGFKNGQMFLKPTADPAGLAERRASMDLPPMADYRCVMQAVYHMPVQRAAHAKKR